MCVRVYSTCVVYVLSRYYIFFSHHVSLRPAGNKSTCRRFLCTGQDTRRVREYGRLKGKERSLEVHGTNPSDRRMSRHDELKNEKRKKTVKIPKPLVYLFAGIVFIFKSILQWRR